MGRVLVEMNEHLANPKMVLEKGKAYMLDDVLAKQLLKCVPPACRIIRRDDLPSGTKILKQPKQADPVDPNGGNPAPRVASDKEGKEDDSIEEVVINEDSKSKGK